MKRLMCSLLCGLLLLNGCSFSDRFVTVSKESLPRTVTIYVMAVVERFEITLDEKGFDIKKSTAMARFSGAGAFVSEHNHILTCNHLFDFKEIDSITVCGYDGTCTAGELLYTEQNLDLALIQANFDEPTPYLRVADPRSLKVGQEVIAIGSPLSFPFSVSHGIISALNRDEVGIYNATQSDTFINPGNSGGPLINLKGELIGVNSRIVPPIKANVFTGLGFSVSAGQIIEFLTRYKRKYLL